MDAREAGDASPPGYGPEHESAAELDPPEVLDGEVVDDSIKREGGDPRMLRAVQMLSRHRGPLPSEEWLTAVEELEPGTTRRLVDDFVAEREHQRSMQLHAVEIDRQSFLSFARYQNLQLLAAWSVVTMIAAGGIVLIATHHAIGGLIALVSELAVLAGVFIGRQVIEGRRSHALESGGDDDSTMPE